LPNHPHNPTADEALIARVAQGDETAFAALYDRLSRPLYSLAVKILGDATDAENALQEACLQIWRRAATYDANKSSVFTWAVLITRSKVIDYLRARGRQQRLVQDLVESGESPRSSTASATESVSDIVEKSDEATRVQAILNQLPPEQREAIELAFFADLTHHDIAARLAQPLGTIKARIRRGLLRLRDALQRGRSL
jgi:RNA polymerase sigma-70 factor, ECF subfamily